MAGSDDKPKWMTKAQTWAEGATQKLQDNAEELSSQLSQTAAWTKVKGAAEDGRTWAQGAANKAKERTADAVATAQKLIVTLGSAPNDLDNPTALIARFVEALDAVQSQLDQQAQAIAIGYLGGGGIGVAGLSGTEIFYLRPDGPVQAHLRVSQVVGREARLAVGASTGAYAACFYGPREVLARPARRRGADVGALVASLAFLRLDAADRRASGWMVGLSAGLELGIPIVSNFSAFDLEEQPLGGIKLTTAQSAPIEERIASAPDRSWRRRIALAL